MAEQIVVVGLPATEALPAATLVVGGRRQLGQVTIPPGARTLTIGGDLGPVLDAVAAEPGVVCILASGDPGFFGIVRALAERFGPGSLEVRPAPSSVSLAFARLGLPWDDALVVSAHGRPLSAAAAAAVGAAKVAVLVSPESPPEALGKELLALGASPAAVAICSRLGRADEVVHHSDLDGLAAGVWDPLSVVVLVRGSGFGAEAQLEWGRPGATPGPGAPLGAGPTGGSTTRVATETAGAPLTWGRADDVFAHRGGMVTKSEVRAVALGKLELPARGVLWDVGAGSGSAALECALLCPALRVFAIESRPEDAGRIEENARHLGADLSVVQGRAPGALVDLPDPDRAFVGGGGLDVLDAVIGRLRPGGRAVATFAALDRAAAAAQRLGHLVQIAASRGERLPDGGWRLVATNPVFVAWGPRP